MLTISLKHSLNIIFIMLLTLTTVKCQIKCELANTVFTQQSQLDSFLILNPNCIYADTMRIYGQNITTLHALKNLKKIDVLQISATNITSIAGLEKLERCYYLELSGNKQLIDLKILKNLNYAFRVAITFNDVIKSYEGISGDSLINIVILGNKQVKDLTGLNSKYCKDLLIIGGNLTNLSNHQLLGLKELTLEEVSNIDSIGSFPITKLSIGNNHLLTNISEIDQLKYLTDIRLWSNNNLSKCDIEKICKNLDNPDFRLIVSLNSIGCNSKEEIRERCMLSSDKTAVTNKLQIYPQPIIDDIFITGLTDQIEYKIINIEGKIIQNGLTSSSIDVSSLSRGFYLLQLFHKNKDIEIETFKVIKL